MQRCVLYCKRTTCSAQLPALLGRCSVHASCVHACPHLSRVATTARPSWAWTRARTCARVSELLYSRDARSGERRACECVWVRVSACVPRASTFTRRWTTRRGIQARGGQPPSSLHSPVSPKISTLSSRNSRLLRWENLVSFALRARTYALYSTCEATLSATGHCDPLGG